MDHEIIVRPAPALRVEFARWAVGQSSRIRTCSDADFSVPADLFTMAPENVLEGALVDGHLYVSVAEAPEDPLEAEQAPTISGLFLCEDCDKTSTTAAGLAAHRRAKHATKEGD